MKEYKKNKFGCDIIAETSSDGRLSADSEISFDGDGFTIMYDYQSLGVTMGEFKKMVEYAKDKGWIT